MMLVGGGLRVALVTIHQPLAKVVTSLTPALIAEIGGCMRDASICGLGQAASSAVESAIDRLGVFKEGAR
jgi:NADH-quinone oxidoreductase subunit F